MTKKNGTNGNKAPPSPPPPPPPLSEDEALAIAHGAATAAYDYLAALRAGDTDALPAGRYWYSCGVVEDVAVTAERLRLLAQFLLDHPGIPAAGAYLYMTREVRRQRPETWHELPLPLRQAYAVFASVLPPLVLEARREARRVAEQARVPSPPPPDRGIFKRAGKQFSNKALRVHAEPNQKGHVAR